MSALFLSLSLVLLAQSGLAINCKGCTPLDSMTFDKLVDKFKASLIKFDVAYPYGDKHEEFGKFSADAAEVDDLLVGEVGIKDYGEKDNEELGKRFDAADKDEFPVVLLFLKDLKTGSLQHFRFSDEFKADNLKSFVRQKTGIYLPLPGCMEEFDLLADKLMTAKDAGEKGQVVAEAERSRKQMDSEEKANRAEVYVKTMHKVVSEGEQFVAKEAERVKKVMEGKVSEAKKKQLEQRLNILKSFARQKSDSKEEL